MFPTRMAALRAVQLKKPGPSTTPANGLQVPQQAVLHWTGNVEETVTLDYLASGAARDCFVAEGRNYVLKLQKGIWHDRSNFREMELGLSDFGECTPKVYGCVVTTWNNEDVSVLVMELVQDTFTAYFAKMAQCSVDEVTLHLAVCTISGFFNLVRRAAGDLKYCLSDLHWKNVGVSAEGNVVILDFESCSYSKEAGQKARCNDAIRSWLKDLHHFAKKHFPEVPLEHTFVNHLQRGLGVVANVLPSTAFIV